MSRKVDIEWFHTETFRATVEVDDDFQLSGEDADKKLEEIICEMDHTELSAAFQGCTDREITSKRGVTND